MLESIYRAAGLRVGLFTSPHLVSFRERIQINRQLISENDVVRLVGKLQPLFKEFSENHHPTFFEVIAVLALKFFAEQKCDLVIWETGLGGRLDATNIVTPLASVITNIAFDHTQWLGDTLEKIAAEKAGIIKKGIAVVTCVEEPEALNVIEEVARTNLSPLVKANLPNSEFRIQNSGLSLLGEHQRQNAALALAVVDVLQKQIPVSETQIKSGLKNVNWPGRLQLVEKPDGQKFLLDGAHNVAGAKTLQNFLDKFSQTNLAKKLEICPSPQPSPPMGAREKNSVENLSLILGVLQDKNWREICEIFAPLAEKIFCVPVASERTANPNELAEVCRQINPRAEIVACDSLAGALRKVSAEKFIVVTGSLYLVGEALELLGLSPANRTERALNEWSVSR